MRGPTLLERATQAHAEGRRLVVPLMGFPGLGMTGCTVKLAQQNYGEHFLVVKALADAFMPDAMFPLMDLSVEANALGRYTVFPKEESATVAKDAFCLEDLDRYERISMAFDTRLLGYVETLKLMRIGLPQTMLRGAYVTGPYTLAALIMGADEAALATLLRPDDLHAICRLATKKILEYAGLLLAAGAQVICVLEPSSVMLGAAQFSQFSAQYVRRIVEGCSRADVSVVYHICGNSMHLLEAMAATGVDALSLDSPQAGIDLRLAAERIPENVVLIGNVNPVGSLLHGEPCDVEQDVVQLLDTMRLHPNFILSTGCDLPQETPFENIRAFMDAGRKRSEIR